METLWSGRMIDSILISSIILAIIKPAVIVGAVWFGWWLRGKKRER